MIVEVCSLIFHQKLCKVDTLINFIHRNGNINALQFDSLARSVLLFAPGDGIVAITPIDLDVLSKLAAEASLAPSM